MGYDQNFCVENERITSELICSICTDIFKDAVVILKRSCNHTFCNTCISNSMVHDNRCPECRSDINGNDLMPDRRTRNLVNKLLFRCETPECEMRFTLSEKIRHEKEYHPTEKKCDFCNAVFKIAGQKKHESNCVKFLKNTIENLRLEKNESSPFKMTITASKVQFPIKVPTTKVFADSGKDTEKEWFSIQSNFKIIRDVPIAVSITFRKFFDSKKEFWFGINVTRLIESSINLKWSIELIGEDKRTIFENSYQRLFSDSNGKAWGSVVNLFDVKTGTAIVHVAEMNIIEREKIDKMEFLMQNPTKKFHETKQQYSSETLGVYDSYSYLSEKKLYHGITVYLKCDLRIFEDGKRDELSIYLMIGTEKYESIDAAWAIAAETEAGKHIWSHNYSKIFKKDKGWGSPILPKPNARKIRFKIIFHRFSKKT